MILGSDIVTSLGLCLIKSIDIFITDNGFLKSCASLPDNSPIADRRSDFSTCWVFSSTRFSRLSLCAVSSVVLILTRRERFLFIVITITATTPNIATTPKKRLWEISWSTVSKVELTREIKTTIQSIATVSGIPNLVIVSKWTFSEKRSSR